MLALTTPIPLETIRQLRAGDEVTLSGEVYTARDAAHRRMAESLGSPPFPFEGAAVFYAGPAPTPPGKVIGAIGPTTSGRMDAYAPALMARGLRVMIGKGPRGPAVLEALRRHTGVYLCALGGTAALTARRVTEASLAAFPDLGPEAVYRLRLEALPLIVGADCLGAQIVQ
jgi:fumarate hydratase subunit beta